MKTSKRFQILYKVFQYNRIYSQSLIYNSFYKNNTVIQICVTSRYKHVKSNNRQYINAPKIVCFYQKPYFSCKVILKKVSLNSVVNFLSFFGQKKFETVDITIIQHSGACQIILDIGPFIASRPVSSQESFLMFLQILQM